MLLRGTTKLPQKKIVIQNFKPLGKKKITQSLPARHALV
jgi:hypothetical protein